MNKSIIKHEIRSMKWMLLLSILGSLFLATMFGVFLEGSYSRMFLRGILPNQAFIQAAFRETSFMILMGFSLLATIQVFMQFKSEKDQETARFLKSLPVQNREFFIIKLAIGIINLTLAFLVLSIGIIVVRSNNMFWIKDIHSISSISEVFMKMDGVGSLLKELGLIYLVILAFYSFLFMIQYSFTHIVGGIVTGLLVWLAPIFIVLSSIFALGRISPISLYNSTLLNKINGIAEWLLPHSYPLTYNHQYFYSDSNIELARISTIDNLQAKYMILLVLILVNIFIAYKFSENSKVEDENKLIVFKVTENIFKFGVTICSGLLLSMIASEIMMIPVNRIFYSSLILVGGLVGYLVSRRITKVENL